MKGIIVCIAGRSCSGKTTLQQGLLDNGIGERVVSYTTRPMRDGEVDGVDYHFLSEEEYNGRTFEIGTELYGNKYGISVEEIKSKQDLGINQIFVIDEQGILDLLDNDVENVCYVEIGCSEKTSRERLTARGNMTTEQINNRIYDDTLRARLYYDIIRRDNISYIYIAERETPQQALDYTMSEINGYYQEEINENISE